MALDTPALDTLVVFGYGPVGADGRLNIYARLAALAAATLLEQGVTKRLLITGGKTGGDALPSEAALMKAYLARHVPVSPRQVVREEEAADTLDNVVLSANLLDAERGSGGRADEHLGFLALRMHGPRVRYLADLIGLTGTFTPLESVIAERSKRHGQFLEQLTKTPAYARLAASQVRAMRGLAELPGFWLPPLGRLENPARLRRVQAHPALATLNLPADPGAFKNALLNMPRRYPEPHPDDLRLGLGAAHG